MLWILIIVVLVLVVWKKATSSSLENRVYSEDNAEINANFARGAIQFFDSYLSLCHKHSVRGVCGLCQQGSDGFGINAELVCVITSVDRKYGEEAFQDLADECNLVYREKKISEDALAAIKAKDNYIKNYFGCDDIHCSFTEIEAYQFDSRQAKVSYESKMITSFGAKWQPTLYYIKQELLKKWEHANIEIGKDGMTVE